MGLFYFLHFVTFISHHHLLSLVLILSLTPRRPSRILQRPLGLRTLLTFAQLTLTSTVNP
jgi:hypothetical protein